MNGFHVHLHAQIEWVNDLCHDFLYVIYFWHTTNWIWVGIVIIYVKNEQFVVHLGLVVKCCSLKGNQSESVIKYY